MKVAVKSAQAPIAASHRVIPALLKSLRLHQWLKNLLVFVPLSLFLSHAGTKLFLDVLAAFLLLGLLTSGTYLFNDIVDVEADRKHPRKCQRPIASSELSLTIAAIAGITLIVCSLFGALSLNLAFFATLCTYLVVTLGYSLFLKRLPLVDVLVIASLFTLRIIAGMTLVGAPPSEWLLMFSIFFFFSLALMKRAVELDVADQIGRKSLKGRGYGIEDRNFVITFGIASGVASLVIFALFVSAMIREPKGTYATPDFLWGIMPALSYWLMRMWLITTRGLMDDDPILYAAQERASLILAVVVAAFALAAQLVHL